MVIMNQTLLLRPSAIDIVVIDTPEIEKISSARPKRILYADLLRIVATLFVIVVHVTSGKVDTVPVTDQSWEFFNIIHGLSRWCVPVFFMLSGMVFLNPKFTITTKTLFKKYIFRIICALVCWGILYGLFTLITASLTGESSFTVSKLLLIPRSIPFGPPYYHLWYLYAIIALYVFTPVLRILVAHMQRKHIEYYLILFILLSIVIPCVNHYLMLINPKYRISFGIPELNGYAGYFIAGYYFSRYDLGPKLKNALYVTALLLSIAALYIISLQSGLDYKPVRYLYGYNVPNVAFAAFAIFVGFKSLFKNRSFNAVVSGAITYLSSLTFGIFLIHPMFLKILSINNIDAQSFTPVLSVPLLSLFLLFLSAVATGLLKKIPGFGKYCI
jgi:surface polysaccharide O-acyltransferase-like enzyme